MPYRTTLVDRHDHLADQVVSVCRAYPNYSCQIVRPQQHDRVQCAVKVLISPFGRMRHRRISQIAAVERSDQSLTRHRDDPFRLTPGGYGRYLSLGPLWRGDPDHTISEPCAPGVQWVVIISWERDHCAIHHGGLGDNVRTGRKCIIMQQDLSAAWAHSCDRARFHERFVI